MKYAVAYLNFFDNNLRLIKVEANDPITAIIEGVSKLTDSSEIAEWLNPMLENIPASDGYAARIEEIRQAFFDTDQIVEVLPIP